MDITLSFLREKIDQVDAKILRDIAERFGVVREMAAVKKTVGMATFQPEREQEMLQQRKKIGASLGISENFVEDLFLLLLSTSRGIQKQEMTKNILTSPEESI